jgi:hypothetical protein
VSAGTYREIRCGRKPMLGADAVRDENVWMREREKVYGCSVEPRPGNTLGELERSTSSERSKSKSKFKLKLKPRS